MTAQFSNEALLGLSVFLSELAIVASKHPTLAQMTGQPEGGPLIFKGVPDACKRFPDIYKIDAIRWQLRNRHKNGLIQCGAVLEVWPSGEAKRPQTKIVHEKYRLWLQAQKLA